jgi:hypothetical protein
MLFDDERGKTRRPGQCGPLRFAGVGIAARVRTETMVPAAWIADRLQMGTAGHVNTRLNRWHKGLLQGRYNE